MSEYLKIMSRKRSWTPVAVDKGQVTEGSEDTLKRCLALRTLELPVKEMLQQGLEVVELHRAVRTGVRHQGVVEVALQEVIFVLGGSGTTVPTPGVATAVELTLLQTWLCGATGTGLLLDIF